MFKPISVTAEFVRQTTPPMPADAVNNVFKVMHGFYGNLFLSKFSTGALDADGADGGITSAKQIWAHGLRDFDGGTVKSALSQCITEHPQYPPSLPQFVSLCRANKPREAYRAPQPVIGMSQELRSKYARQAREINARHAQRAIDKRTGFIEIEPGLQGLKRAIANAVATAGGDEVAELRRLDEMFAPGAAA